MELQLAQTLQALGNLSLIILCFCMLYGIKRMVQIYQELLIVSARLDSHISLDNEKFDRLNQNVGTLFSITNDLRNDKASGLATTLEQLLRKG